MNKIFIIIFTIIALPSSVHLGPVSVPQGGTGLTLTQAYAFLCAGNNATNSALENLSYGTAGQTLIGNGSSALPSWQNAFPGYTKNSNFLYAGSSSITTNSPQENTILTAIAPSSIGNANIRTTLMGYNPLQNIAVNASTQGQTVAGNNTLTSFSTNNGVSLTAIGHSTLTALTTGNNHTAIGNNIAPTATTLNFAFITAVGNNSLQNATTTTGCCAAGHQALQAVTSAGAHTAVGYQACFKSAANSSNTVIGHQGCNNLAAGGGNTALGYQAMFNTTNSASNCVIGSSAAGNLTSGNNNIYIGYNTQAITTTDANTTVIGNNGAQATATAYFFGINGATSTAGVSVLINSSGKLGTTTSSLRTKKNIAELTTQISNKIYELEPKTFHYKIDTAENPEIQYGLIAQEVEKIMPDLVVYDTTGKIITLRYQEFDALLIKNIQELNQRLDSLQNLADRLENEIKNKQKTAMIKSVQNSTLHG